MEVQESIETPGGSKEIVRRSTKSSIIRNVPKPAGLSKPGKTETPKPTVPSKPSKVDATKQVAQSKSGKPVEKVGNH